MRRLNLGCGQFPKDGYVNVDADPRAKADVFCDLAEMPYPFDDASFDVVEMSHVLEHLPDPMAAMAEIHRILKPGGTVEIRVPHFTRGFTHWDHKRGFDVSFPYYFDPAFAGGYVGFRFEHRSTRLVWFAQKYLKKAVLGPLAYSGGVVLGWIFDALGNLNLFLTSRLFSFWVGGYEEIVFVLAKPAEKSS